MRSVTCPTITKRQRKRVLNSKTVIQRRFVVNFLDPATGKRHQFFFERLRDAQEKRDALLQVTRVPTAEALLPRKAIFQAPTPPPRRAEDELTVGQAVSEWLTRLDPHLKPTTKKYYEQISSYIVRPLLVGTTVQRRRWTRSGALPREAARLELLASVPLGSLRTGEIRAWHQLLTTHVGAHTANAAKKVLAAVLAQTAEDRDVDIPRMPRKLGKGKTRSTRRILTPEQVGLLLDAARNDPAKGIYYAFPFLAGVRPSEQLGLLWDDVDLDRGIIQIRRMQEIDGTLSNLTKTPAGVRQIPMSPLLKTLLSDWRARSPNTEGQARVFSTVGTPGSRRHPNAGRVLTYANFRTSYWRPALEKLGLPYVSPHSARHTFISTLQAGGVEVALVAKLVGHANARVTIDYYSQAVRGGEAAVVALEQAYGEPGDARRNTRGTA